ncbi:hypothetical protein tb265_47160 [Gemmatimonadetes bacterium T265]|nr:hypothetical protein tb265_47160 [Gemmatimonadetes bacterium T265]
MRRRYADPPAASTTTAAGTRRQRGDAQLSVHIFSVSSGLVGVYLTVIGLFRIIVRSQHVDSIADNLLAVNALLFLAACALAYLALRTRTDARADRLECAADVAFLSALAMMAVIGVLVAYEVI